MTYHDKTTSQCEKEFKFSLCQYAKRAIQTFRLFEVNVIFEVFCHNFNFSVFDCASFVHCAFVAQISSEDFLASAKESEQND